MRTYTTWNWRKPEAVIDRWHDLNAMASEDMAAGVKLGSRTFVVIEELCELTTELEAHGYTYDFTTHEWKGVGA